MSDLLATKVNTPHVKIGPNEPRSLILAVRAGETQQEVQQRLLREREMKIRAALEKLSRKRRLLRTRRKHKEFPIVSVLGYTNCGKTSHFGTTSKKIGGIKYILKN